MSGPDLPPILLVEDNPEHAMLTEAALRNLSVPNPVTHLSNGREAVAYLSGGAPYENRAESPFPRLMLLDLEMPEMTGDEVLEWMRGGDQPDRIQELPVVVVTEIEDPERRERVRELGADAVVEKTANPVEFAGRLRRACEEWIPGLRSDRGGGSEGRSEVS